MKNVFILCAVVLVGIAFYAGMQFASRHPSVPETATVPVRTNTETPVRPTGGESSPDVTAPTTGSVTIVNLSNEGLTKVPGTLFTKTSVTELNLSHNALSGALPAEVRNLSQLKTIILSHNNFTGVPAEIGQLSVLEVLDLSYNPITGLPNELGNLSHLKVLDLRGTQYSSQDLEGIKRTLPPDTVIKTGP